MPLQEIKERKKGDTGWGVARIEEKTGHKEICVTKERKEEQGENWEMWEEQKQRYSALSNIWTDVADEGLKRGSPKRRKRRNESG